MLTALLRAARIENFQVIDPTEVGKIGAVGFQD